MDKTLNITLASDAREYIELFDWTGFPTKPTELYLNNGKTILLWSMTDAEAITAAHLLYDMVLEAKENARLHGRLH